MPRHARRSRRARDAAHASAPSGGPTRSSGHAPRSSGGSTTARWSTCCATCMHRGDTVALRVHRAHVHRVRSPRSATTWRASRPPTARVDVRLAADAPLVVRVVAPRGAGGDARRRDASRRSRPACASSTARHVRIGAADAAASSTGELRRRARPGARDRHATAGAAYVPTGSVCVGAPGRRRLILAGQRRQPLEQLVAQEPHLPPAGEAVAGDPPLADHPPQVLDVHLEQLRRHRRGEHGREVVGADRARASVAERSRAPSSVLRSCRECPVRQRSCRSDRSLGILPDRADARHSGLDDMTDRHARPNRRSDMREPGSTHGDDGAAERRLRRAARRRALSGRRLAGPRRDGRRRDRRRRPVVRRAARARWRRPVLVAAHEIRAGETVRPADFRSRGGHDERRRSRRRSCAPRDRRPPPRTDRGDHASPRASWSSTRTLRPRAARHGLRAMSIPIDPARAVGGRLAAGDRVDVLFAGERAVSIIVADAEVLAVDAARTRRDRRVGEPVHGDDRGRRRAQSQLRRGRHRRRRTSRSPARPAPRRRRGTAPESLDRVDADADADGAVTTMEPTVALVFSPEPWVEELHRHLAHHGGARVRQIVVEPSVALDEEYDALVVSDRWPALTWAVRRRGARNAAARCSACSIPRSRRARTISSRSASTRRSRPTHAMAEFVAVLTRARPAIVPGCRERRRPRARPRRRRAVDDR